MRGLERAAREHRPRNLILTGGVAANTLLRREASVRRRRSAAGLIPPLALTTDNAAMIAAAGWRRSERLALNAEPHLRSDGIRGLLTRSTRKTFGEASLRLDRSVAC